MSTQLIAHLKKKCEADDNVKILLSQWEFDQKLVGKALENIGGFYPHFSNHNASHSQQILVNIERLLGEDIGLLSATDTWLILEAAYWHDAGMLVDAEKAKKVHNEENFKKMLREIVQKKSSDLYEFAKVFLNDSWQGAIALEKHPFDGVEKYRQLIAEYFRKEHANRIGSIVLEDYKNLGINTPRTELLPTRLFRYLGNICVGHGMHFDKMMEVLPRCQTGLGTEDCHPLFVACLLRLGDLFDLDDNRFCPVMAKHVSNMPSVSKHHHDKHLSLREFQLDKRTVKLVAECPDEMSYVETQNWFGWIQEEFQNQMSQWNLIVPNQKFGSLPTIEQLDVRIQVKYEGGLKREKLLLNNKPMRFSLDEKKAIEILQGSNLYKDIFSIFRELIQNSIDTTMIRIWKDNKKNDLKNLNPVVLKNNNLIDSYKIKICINTIDINKSIYEIVIRDKGMGISIEDLKFMQKIAGSYKNTHKNKIISEMPIWMRPSGEFGIGMHSAFLLGEKLPSEYKTIKIKTKNIFSNECLEIEMNSPMSEKDGYTFISKVDDENFEFGTELRVFFLFTGNNVDYILKKYNLRNNYPLDDFCYLDILKKNYINNEIEKRILKNSIISFSIEKFDYKKINKRLELMGNDRNSIFSTKGNSIWIDDFKIIFRFKLKDKMYSSYSDSSKVFFKGQLVETDRFYIQSFFDFDIDFYGLDARDILLMNRESVNFNFYNKYQDLSLNAIKKYLKNNLLKFRNYFKDENSYFLLKYELGLMDFNDNDDFEAISEVVVDQFFEKKLSILKNKKNFFIINDSSDMDDLFGEDYMKSIKDVEFIEPTNYSYSLLISDYLDFLKKEKVMVFEKGNDFFDAGYFVFNSKNKFNEFEKKIPNQYFLNSTQKEKSDKYLDSILNKFTTSYSRDINSVGNLIFVDLHRDFNDFKKISVDQKLIFPFYKIDKNIFEISSEYFVEYFMSKYGNTKNITKEECFTTYQKFTEVVKERARHHKEWQKYLQK